MRSLPPRPRQPLRRRLTTAALAALLVAGLGVWATAGAAARPAAVPAPATAAGAAATGAVSATDTAGDIAEAAADLTGDIAFTPPSRTFTNQIAVTLASSVAGAEIRYTTDGQAPTASSAVYTTAVQLTRTAQIRAQAFVNGTATGSPGTALYVANTVTTAHDLPVLALDSYGQGQPNQDDWMDVSVLQFDPVNGSTSLAATPTIAARAGFHLRGQSSALFDKKQYRLELRDNQDDDLDWPLLGMPADSDWVLLGPYDDKSLIRNAFMYGLGRDMGLQAPRFAFAEVYVNTDAQPISASDYVGVYMVVETIKDAKNRLDLKQLDEDDTTLPKITGGYIWQFQWMGAEEPTLQCAGSSSTCWHDLEVVDPEPLNSPQKDWLTQHIQQFNDMINSSTYTDPTNGYRAWIDVRSWVDQLIIQELGRNMDAYVRSQYFYKDRDGVINAGPLWDYDLTFGIGGYYNNTQIAGWQYQQTRQPIANDWFQRLMQDPAFVNEVRARWSQLRQGLLSDAQLRARVTALAAPLTNAAQRNFQRWPNLTAPVVGPFTTPTANTWQGQVDYLRDWALQRAAWLDTSGGWLVPVSPTASPTPASPTPTPTRTASPMPTASSTATPTPTATGTAACSAAYTVTSQWQGGFQASVQVAAGNRAIAGWRVTWTFANGQTVSQIWNATATQNGTTVTAVNMSYNGSLAAGANTSFGFLGTWTTANTAPSLTCTAT